MRLKNKHETKREWETSREAASARRCFPVHSPVRGSALVAIVVVSKNKGGIGAGITLGLLVAFIALIPFSAAGRLDELVEPMARAPKRNRAQLDRLLAEVRGQTIGEVDITATEERIAELANERVRSNAKSPNAKRCSSRRKVPG